MKKSLSLLIVLVILFALPLSAGCGMTGKFIGDNSTRLFHVPTCFKIKDLKIEKRVSFSTADSARSAGYKPCSSCQPQLHK